MQKNASQMLFWNRKMPIYDMMMSDIYWIFHGFIKCHLLKKRSFILWMCHHHPELRLQCNLSKLLNSRAGTADTGIDYFRKLAWLPKAPLCKVWNLTIKKLCWGELFQKGNESYEQTILLRGGISLAGKNSAIYERSFWKSSKRKNYQKISCEK